VGKSARTSDLLHFRAGSSRSLTIKLPAMSSAAAVRRASDAVLGTVFVYPGPRMWVQVQDLVFRTVVMVCSRIVDRGMNFDRQLSLFGTGL